MPSLDELYMSRRMSIVSRAQDLTPSMQFDLATSPLANHELEAAVEHFNPKPQTEGWGFANVFEEMLSREPRKVPVEDLSKLQQNLKNEGYLPPDHPTDGVWGPDSAAAFSQFDRDNGDQVRQGNNLLSGTVQDGVRFFGSMLPRSVIQGVIGTAKGIVEQTPETLERGGFLGGAAEGAAVGAALGTATDWFTLGAGTLVGAAIGGVAGFLTSMLDKDEKDGNRNEGFMDALTPFNEGEWTTARNFAEDVGYVATVASVVSGAGQIAKGVGALGALRGSLTALNPVTKPGFVANMLGSAKGATALGAFAGGAHGLATGDDLGDVVQGAVEGGVAGFLIGASPVGAKLRDLAATYGLKRIATNPVVSGINATFTGGVMINVGGRYAGGFGSGEKTTAIEQNIKDAPVVLPEWADLIGGMVLLPERLAPVSLGEIGSAARSWLGGVDGVARRPWFQALETIKDAEGRVYSKSKVRSIVEAITPEQDLYTREQFGIQQATKWVLEQDKLEATRLAAEGKGEGWFAASDIERRYQDAHNAVMDWYKADPVKNKDFLMSLSTEDPNEFAAYLVRNEAKGGGVEQWAKFEPAQLQAEQLALAARNGELEASIMGKSLKEELEAGAVKTETKAPTFVAAKPEYMTTRDWQNAADEYTRLVGNARRAREAADNISEDIGMEAEKTQALLNAADARDELMGFIRTFRGDDPHRVLPESVVDLALGAETNKHYVTRDGKKVLDKETLAFADFLRDKAKYAGKDVDLADPALAQTITDNGYKLIATGENTRMLGEVKELAALHNVGDYTKRASFFEVAGLSPFAVTEHDVGILKQAHMENSIGRAIDELGIAIPQREAVDKLVDKMHSVNNDGHRWLSFITEEGDRSFIRRTRLLKVDLRQLKLDDIVDALKLDEGAFTQVSDPLRAAQVIKDGIHSGSVFGGEVSFAPTHWADTVRQLGSALRVEGLTGFSDFMRQFRIENPARALTVAGGVVGAGVGAQEDGLEGAIKGGIAGTLAMGSLAYGGKAFLKKWPSKSPFKPNTYGWLPNNLHNAAMALRYSLSFTFDLGRRMEQASIASMEYGMPVTLAPKSYALRHFADDFGGNPDNVMSGIRQELDDIMGHSLAMNADDMDRRAAAVGLTGFSQRDADAVYAHLMVKQGKMSKAQIKDAVYKLGHYGARTGAERSLNFVLFPFSFQKKMLTTLHNFLLAEPARALLVHEGMRQWYKVRDDKSMSERFAELTEKYLPMAQEIAMLNNLSYGGISGGRFFLEGLTNNRTLLGKVSQSLAAVFTPSGAVTPLQQAVGHAGDAMVNFFSPIFLTGEDTENMTKILTDFAPIARDVQNLVIGRGENQPSILSQQLTAATSVDAMVKGGGGAPWYQLRQYNNEKREIKAEYADLAAAFGYSSVDGFFQSDMGAPYAQEAEQKILALGDKYPTGLAKSQYLESSTALDDKAKAEILSDPNPSTAEYMIGKLIEMEAEASTMADMLGMTQDEMLPRLSQDIRGIAVKFSNDPRFRELYDRFFSYRYGPISETDTGRAA